MTDTQVEVTQADLEALVQQDPVIRIRLQNIALQRVVEAQAEEIKLLDSKCDCEVSGGTENA